MSNWNRKYRPRMIADLHLTVVREQLQAFLKSGSLPQVFVFAGPKGTGKTSTARIIGSLVNNPENDQQIRALYFDKNPLNKPLVDSIPSDAQFEKIFEGGSFIVQELDAASNRGIDDIRALKERVSMPPSFGTVSVYILDEAHMLTTEAFNALLKVLEEPPAHAIFILATTELHKIPETVLSRAHVVHFQKASVEEMAVALENVLKKETISYEKPALTLLAEQADGSFRDAIKLLESFAQTGAITVERFEADQTLHQNRHVTELITTIIEKNIEQVVSIFVTLRTNNVQEVYFHTLLLKTLHISLQQALGLQAGKPLVPFEAAKFLLSELSAAHLSEPSPLPLLALEMKIIEIISRSKKKSPTNNEGNSGGKPSTSSVRNEPSNPVVTKQPLKAEVVAVETIVTTPHLKETESISFIDKADGSLLVAQWPQFVEAMAKYNATVAALLRSARPVEGQLGSVTVKVFYSFHQEQLKSTKFNQMIRACAEEMLQGAVEFIFLVEEPILQTELTDVKNVQDLTSVATQALM